MWAPRRFSTPKRADDPHLWSDTTMQIPRAGDQCLTVRWGSDGRARAVSSSHVTGTVRDTVSAAALVRDYVSPSGKSSQRWCHWQHSSSRQSESARCVDGPSCWCFGLPGHFKAPRPAKMGKERWGVPARLPHPGLATTSQGLARQGPLSALGRRLPRTFGSTASHASTPTEHTHPQDRSQPAITT